MEGWIVEDWGRWICVRWGSLWNLFLLLDCLSCPPANNNFIFSLSLFFFEKKLCCLREVFTLAVCPGCLKGGFHPGIFLFIFLFFFSSLGRLTRFSTQRWDSCASWRFSPESLFFFLFQWLDEGGDEPWSTIITILLILLMNSCFDKGLLYIFNRCPLTSNGMAYSSMVLICTEPLSWHLSIT